MAEFGNPAAKRRQAVFNAVRKAVKDYAKAQVAEGRFATMTPAELKSLENYDPLVRLALMEADPQTPRNMRMLIAFKLAEILHAPLLESDNADGRDNLPPVGVIRYTTKQVSAPAAGLHTRAIEAEEPRKVEVEVVVADGDTES